ncbi:MAG TPA: hypothetical protein VE422_30760 [Terriglobia bacterium]|nr:hypothetical protein [Terriglobia bacterium]
MGLDVSNELFGNFHVNWRGTRWFSEWCSKQGLPNPFVGWESGCNNGDQCDLAANAAHIAHAKRWFEALEETHPDLAALGKTLLENPPTDLYSYLYPHNGDGEEELSEAEWSRRALAAWYAILRHGVEHGDILEYW